MKTYINISLIDPRPNATGYIITPGFKGGFLLRRAVMPIYGLVYYLQEGHVLCQDIDDGLKCMRAIEEEIKQTETRDNAEKLKTLQRKYESEKDLVKRLTNDYNHRFPTLWVIAYDVPEGDRRRKIYPRVESEDLEEVIDQAAAIFSKNAHIKTLDKPLFSHDLQFSNSERKWLAELGHVVRSFPRYREFPVPEGVLQYFRKEIRKRRQKLIGEID